MTMYICTCTVGSSGIRCGLLKKAEVGIQSPTHTTTTTKTTTLNTMMKSFPQPVEVYIPCVVVDLNEDLVVYKESIPAALWVWVEGLHRIS